MSQNNNNAKSAPAADTAAADAAAGFAAGAASAAEAAANATGGPAPAAAPSTPAAVATAKKKYFGFGLVAGVATGIGGVFAWQRWGNRVAG